jgi:carboxymethylenebutenolidase
MIEKLIDIPTADGRMDAFVAHPEEGGPFPAVAVLMDIWGLREELFDVARRAATVGYFCILPNFWYRRGRVRYEFRDQRGRMLSLDVLPKEKQDEIRGNARQVSDRMAMADIGALLKHLPSEPAARQGPKGSLGYCLGGRYALQAAAEFPDQFLASASMHGTALVNDTPDSPHRFVEKMRGEIYCGFAEHDPYMSLPAVDTLTGLFKNSSSVSFRGVVHPGAHHGYALPDRDIFDKPAANRDWENIFAMFRRQLG